MTTYRPINVSSVPPRSFVLATSGANHRVVESFDGPDASERAAKLADALNARAQKEARP